ncbi:acetate CoA-transferase YdiF [Spirochaetia bacterium]|nr:acetate CoA-transferase YdiF [Spirochaetia bacterium]
MPVFVTAREAVGHIRSGTHVWSNAFLALANPIELQTALGAAVRETGQPRDLTFCCTSGFGDWTEDSSNEDFVRLGAVNSFILGHISSMPATARMIMENKVEGYNLPLGVMSKMVRAAASGENYFITDIGLNLFVDPKYHGYRLNRRSGEELVTDMVIDGKRRLKYRIPPMDVALIKGSYADDEGNVSFEKECTVGDALSLAQAVKRQKGIVIVQVEGVLHRHQRPWNVVIPAPLIDMIAVCPEQTQVAGLHGYIPAYAGDEYFTADPMRDYVLKIEASNPPARIERKLIARRALKEFKSGDIANIGIGIPEGVAVEAAKSGLLHQAVLTVESGAMHGVPASGKAFGAAIGAHSICDMAHQFDFYDGGGLDICFIGALEIDREGNVNGHVSEGRLPGIGGFANITQSTPKVVFCATFTAEGLEVSEKNGQVRIIHEGRRPKLVKKVKAISFSAENAHNNGQEVLYITERCVFRLGKDGLELIEAAPGIDIQKDILDHLDFSPAVSISKEEGGH